MALGVSFATTEFAVRPPHVSGSDTSAGLTAICAVAELTAGHVPGARFVLVAHVFRLLRRSVIAAAQILTIPAPGGPSRMIEMGQRSRSTSSAVAGIANAASLQTNGISG